MKIMRQCLYLWILSGYRPATVCMFCVPVQIALCIYACKTSACFRPYERQQVCPCVSVTRGLTNGRRTHTGRRASDPVPLRLSLLREVWGLLAHAPSTISAPAWIFKLSIIRCLCDLFLLCPLTWNFKGIRCDGNERSNLKDVARHCATSTELCRNASKYETGNTTDEWSHQLLDIFRFVCKENMFYIYSICSVNSNKQETFIFSCIRCYMKKNGRVKMETHLKVNHPSATYWG